MALKIETKMKTKLEMKQKKQQFYHTSTTSVRAYFIQVFEFFTCTSISRTGLGGRPWPSQRRLSHANDISHIGISAGSEK